MSTNGNKNEPVVASIGLSLVAYSFVVQLKEMRFRHSELLED
jgi:hypothetical protein